jgi:hypothetical protein
MLKNQKTKKTKINESLGVPSEIDMITSIFVDLVKSKLFEYKNENKELETNTVEVRNYGETEKKSGSFQITDEESWNFVKNSDKFNPQEWRKFPLYKNPILVSFDILPDGAFSESGMDMPTINASHGFATDEFKIKKLSDDTEIFDVSKFEFMIYMGESNWENVETLSPKIDSVISQEVFHAFQLYTKYVKSKKIGFGKENVYNSLSNILKTEFSPDFNRFLHILYLSLRFEHQARVPQALKILKNERIDNYNDFMVAIKKTDMWDDIIKLKSFSADKLIQDMDKIETLFDIIMKGPQKNFVKERIFDWNDVVDRVIDMSINSGLNVEPIRGLSSKTTNDPEKFFKHWEKFFHRRGDELFRKLTRLYGLL